MSTQAAFKEFTTPVGRWIFGSLELRQRINYDTKQPEVNEDGSPVMEASFGLAIAKNGTTQWSQLPFAAAIVEVARASHGALCDRPDYAWKVIDGDSRVPNKSGNIPAEQEGYPGHWIFRFTTQRAPRVYNANGSQLIDPATVKLGHYIQVQATVRANTGKSPGVYLNPANVAHAGYGPEIFTGPDVARAGFGGPLPAGASSVPVGGLPTAGAPQPAAPVAVAPVVAQPPVVAVAPAPSFLAPPPPAAAPTPPPPAPVKQMTAKAGNATYESFIAQGWTDELMRAQGYLA